MAEIGSVVVNLAANTTALTSGLKKGKKEVDDFSRDAQKSINQAISFGKMMAAAELIDKIGKGFQAAAEKMDAYQRGQASVADILYSGATQLPLVKQVNELAKGLVDVFDQLANGPNLGEEMNKKFLAGVAAIEAQHQAAKEFFDFVRSIRDNLDMVGLDEKTREEEELRLKYRNMFESVDAQRQRFMMLNKKNYERENGATLLPETSIAFALSPEQENKLLELKAEINEKYNVELAELDKRWAEKRAKEAAEIEEDTWDDFLKWQDAEIKKMNEAEEERNKILEHRQSLIEGVMTLGEKATMQLAQIDEDAKALTLPQWAVERMRANVMETLQGSMEQAKITALPATVERRISYAFLGQQQDSPAVKIAKTTQDIQKEQLEILRKQWASQQNNQSVAIYVPTN